MSKLIVVLLASLFVAPVFAADAKKIEPQPMSGMSGMEGMQAAMRGEAQKIREQKSKVQKNEAGNSGRKESGTPVTGK